MSDMTLAEFFDHVADVHKRRRAAGVATVYVTHRTLSPHNVRVVWDGVPLNDVPAEGDVIDVPNGGYMGANGHWTVLAVEWKHESGAVFVQVDDAPDGGEDR